MEKVLKILVLDDEFLIRRSLQMTAESLGHQVKTAADGKTALSFWSDFNPDLAFVDILMPGMTGFEFLKKIPKDSSAKIILISAHDNLEEKEIKSAGASLFVKKPFDDIFKLMEKAVKLVLP